MTVVDAGPLTLEKAKLVAFAEGQVSVPTTVAIFQHPAHGVILWDTGCNDAVADPDRAESYWGIGIKAAFGAHGFTRDHAIDRQLDTMGIRPRDVRYVIYSHLHLDHAGGMSYFPDATHVVQKSELRYALFPDPWTRPVYCQNDFKDIHKLNVLEIDGDYDLFADGTFRLVKSPGHAPGLQVLFVTLPHRGRFMLGGDIAHLRDQFEAMIPMPWDWSISEMSASRARIKQLERSGVPLYLCHEPGEFAALPGKEDYWD
jgi:glyoxylase-like metal-dependent hydrolase (beta-lactamase superfamily II)